MINKITHNTKQAGFTIIELLAMVVVVGILLALVFATYSGVQRNQHNQERQKDILAIYQQLEAYYVENSKYPTLAEINNPSWRTLNMKMLNNSVLRDPSGKSSTLVALPTEDAFSYDVTAADGGSCDNITRTCAHYTLTATLQDVTPKYFIKSSLN